MPANSATINLLGEEDLAHTPQGRIVTWALTYGRYIMIGTEIVVLLAFISRFSLDRKLTDLREEIDQKQAILEANLPFEMEIRTLQDQIVKIKSLITDQEKPVNTLKLVSSLLPPDVYLNQIEVGDDRVVAEVVSGTTEGLTLFLNNLQSAKQIVKVDIGDIKKSPLSGIVFKLTAYLTAPTKSK